MTRPDPVSGFGVELLESLERHRLLDTAQLQAMHAPHATRRWTQRVLAQLAGQGLIAAAPRTGPWVWYLTAKGGQAMQITSTRPSAQARPITPAQAAGPLQAHTLAVNAVGIAYLTAARARSDEFGPLSWRHEIAHPLGSRPGQRRPEQLIADAVLTYLQAGDEAITVHQRFLELDRATMPVEELAAKLTRYQRLRRYTPKAPVDTGPVEAWRDSYRAFPGVQIVLTGKPRHLLERRIRLVLALHASDPALGDGPAVDVAIALLEDLARHGPFAPVWLRASDPSRRVDWLGGDAAQ
jgi:hypothetical protein